MASAGDASLTGTRGALRALYGAKAEALRRSLAPREIAAALRALAAERHAAFRVLTERRQTDRAAARQVRVTVDRAGDGEARQARGPPRPT